MEKWIFFGLFFLLNRHLFSQENNSSDLLLLEAVEISNVVLENKDDLAPVVDCSSSSESFQEKICLNCLSSNEPIKENDYSFLQFHFDSWDKVPPDLKALPGATLDGHTKGAVQIVLGLPNDNKLFGLWGMMFDTDGDDFGYTHGSSLDMAKTFKNGKTIKINGQSHLYTQYDRENWFRQFDDPDNDGKRSTPFKFTNEAILKITADNIQQQKLLYWKTGVGWTKLDNKNWRSILTGSGQQFRWHNLLQKTLGPEMASDPIYMVNENKIKQSLNLEAFLGLQKNFVFAGNSCRLKLTTEVGGQLNSIGSSYFKSEMGAFLFYQKPGKSFSLMAGGTADKTLFKNGSQFNVKPSIGFQTGRYQMSFVYHQTFGKLNNYTSYNTTDFQGNIEPIMSINIGFLIGRFRSQ
jgi:hypothetical protein